MADLAKYRDAFKDFVEQFADGVDKALASKAALPTLAVDFATIASAFDETPLPYDIVFWPAVAEGDAWKPAGGGRSIAADVAAAAALMRVSVHPFNRTGGLDQQVAKLCKDRQILLVIADAHMAPDNALVALNAAPPPHSVALLLIDAKASPGQPPLAVADWLAGLPIGSFHRAAQRQHAASCLPGNAAAEIEKITTRVRLALINGDDGASAQNAILANEAESRGIPTAAKASLTGSVPTL